MKIMLVVMFSLTVITAAYARRLPPSPIVVSGINNRHVDVIIVARITNIDKRLVDRTDAEIDEARINWERKVRIQESIRFNHMDIFTSEQRAVWEKRELSKSVHVTRRTLIVKEVLKGKLDKGERIHVEWIMTDREVKREAESVLTMHSPGRLSIISLRNPYAGLEYQLEPQGVNSGNLDDAAATQQIERYKNLIGEYIAHMDFLITRINDLSPRGMQMLRELVGPQIEDKGAVVAEWRKERARFNEWNEYQMSDAEKKQLVVDKPADEQLRD